MSGRQIPRLLDAATKILVVEDESGIVDNIVYVLHQEGMQTAVCHYGNEALELFSSQKFDLVILDIGLPDISGLEVCREIRKRSNIPVLFLTARGSEVDRVVGLEIGGDDYVVKPFSPRELAARVKAILRRTRSGPTVEVINSTLFRVEELSKEIYFKGVKLELTKFEFGLLRSLLRHPGQVFSRAELLDLVWRDNLEAKDRVVDGHVKAIRSKLRNIDGSLSPLKTHRGFGYSVQL